MIRISMPLLTQLVIIVAAFGAGVFAAWMGRKRR